MTNTETPSDKVVDAFSALVGGVRRAETNRAPAGQDARMLRWVEAGSGSPAVVFEAGASSPVAGYAAVFAALAGEHRVIAYDRAGYGASDPVELSVQHQLDDLVAVLEAAGPGPSILVGHSWGGLLAQLAAWQRPELIAGLVLVDPSHEQLWRDIDPELIGDARRHPSRSDPIREDPRTEETLRDGDELADDIGRSVATDEATTQLLVDACRSYLATDRQVFCHLDEFPMILDHVDQLAKLRAESTWPRVPVVVLTATKGRPEESTRLVVPLHAELAEITDGRHQVVPDSGHYIHIDKPELIVDCIREVVESGKNVTSETQLGATEPLRQF